MPRIEKDWRKIDFREDLFLRYFSWRTSIHDLDHSHYCKTLCQDMTAEQKTWFGFLFGMTYRTPQAYAYWWTFPDFEQIDREELELWHVDNWKRTSYGTDARYNKGYLVSQVVSLTQWCGKESLHSKVTRLTRSKDPGKNFQTLFDSICEVFKYGRMTAWITCQCLYDVLGLNTDFDNVLIKNPNSDSSMKSVWNGYCMLKGQYDKLLGEQYSTTEYKVTQEDLRLVSQDIMRYRRIAEEYAGRSVDVFKWESIWCQFKRLFNPKASKEYPGHSSGDAVSRYLYYREHWPEVDWSLFREALLSQESIVKGQTYRNDYNGVFGQTGLLLNMHEMFDDMPNAYYVLKLNPNENLVRVLFEDHGMSVPVIDYSHR